MARLAFTSVRSRVYRVCYTLYKKEWTADGEVERRERLCLCLIPEKMDDALQACNGVQQ